MAQIGITSKETELHPVLESNSKNEGFGEEWMAQMNSTLS